MKLDSIAWRLHAKGWVGSPSDHQLPTHGVGTTECLPTFVLRHCFTHIAEAWPSLPDRKKLSDA